MNEIMDIKHPECDSCLMSMILEKASALEVMAESGRPYSDVPNCGLDSKFWKTLEKEVSFLNKERL